MVKFYLLFTTNVIENCRKMIFFHPNGVPVGIYKNGTWRKKFTKREWGHRWWYFGWWRRERRVSFDSIL